MASIDVELNIPDGLAEEARALGLLEPEALAAILREEVRKRRVEQLFQSADRLASSEGPPLTAAEIEAEIQAARTQRRNADAARG